MQISDHHAIRRGNRRHRPGRYGRGQEASAAKAAASRRKAALDKAAIDKAFEALKTFNWGVDHSKYRELLGPIDDAVPATHGDAAARKELETKLAAVLSSGASRAAKDFVGRKLAIIGTAESVPALAALLPDKDLSHMARYALERIPAPEAGKALRDALAKTSGAEKAGVIGSLGARRDAESVADLAALVGDSDAAIAAGCGHGPGRYRHRRVGQGIARCQAARRTAGQAAGGRRPADRRRTSAGRGRQGRGLGRLQVADCQQAGEEHPPGRNPRAVAGQRKESSRKRACRVEPMSWRVAHRTRVTQVGLATYSVPLYVLHVSI